VQVKADNHCYDYPDDEDCKETTVDLLDLFTGNKNTDDSQYPDGTLEERKYSVFSDDVLDGTHKTWYENGNPMEVIPYSKGVVNGTIKTYWEEGGVFEEIKYEYGNPKHMFIYREDGTLFDERGFIDRKIVEGIVG